MWAAVAAPSLWQVLWQEEHPLGQKLGLTAPPGGGHPVSPFPQKRFRVGVQEEAAGGGASICSWPQGPTYMACGR